MNLTKLIINNLKHYYKSNILIILGSIISTTILAGALIIGDSVSLSLNNIVLNRLGESKYALNAGDRHFRIQLAGELSDELNTTVIPLIHTAGIAVANGGEKRQNNTQIYGIDNRFNDLKKGLSLYSNLTSDEVIVNTHLAEKLNLKVDDQLILRFEKLDSMPKETVLSSAENDLIVKRFNIKYITSDIEMGRFSLKNEQSAPYNVFVNLQGINELMELNERANVLLVVNTVKSNLQLINDMLISKWNLDDSGIKITELNFKSQLELTSNRIFLDEQTIKLADKIQSNTKLLSYFVNEISFEKRSTPYSFISSADNNYFDHNLKDKEIIINRWLADDLKAKTGDVLRIKYYSLGEKRNLIEKSEKFIVRSIVDIGGEYGDKDLMPDFPGLTEAESCMDWTPGIPIDFDKIRSKDEKYWNKYKGTPKAFVSLKTAQKLWQNRYGKLTALRFAEVDKKNLQEELDEKIDPSVWGLEFREVRERGFEASSNAVDFSGLFIGLSFFVIVSSLLLTGMLFVLNVETRTEEIGVLLGIGYKKSFINKILLSETLILISIGSVIGLFVGVGYDQVILLALRSIWSDIVRTSSIEIFLLPKTLIIGCFLNITFSVFVVWLFLRKQLKLSSHILQRAQVRFIKRKADSKTSLVISLLCLIGAMVLFVFTDLETGTERFGTFFLIGILILTGGISVINYIFSLNRNAEFTGNFTLSYLGIKNILRNRKRNLLFIGLLASGLFIVFAVGINKKTVPKDFSDRSSGTGGFSFIGETSVPIYEDLNDKKVKQNLGLDEKLNANVNYIQLRVKEGDDASCLNLNRVSNPQVLGVDTEEFIKLNPFSFTSKLNHLYDQNPWSLLDEDISDNVIPGIANETDIIWQMGKSIGDSLKYIDDVGNVFYIRLIAGMANSIFQGNVLISQNHFIEKFENSSGSKIFLVDGKTNSEEFNDNINSSLVDYGINLQLTSIKLAEFNKIENTYLSIFLILGSFGIFIGSFGIAIIVFRNVYEQKSEFALLQSVGIRKVKIQKMIFNGHFLLMLIGILIGIIGAVISSYSSIQDSPNDLPLLTLGVIIFCVVLNGAVCTYVATKISTKGNLIENLRKE